MIKSKRAVPVMKHYFGGEKMLAHSLLENIVERLKEDVELLFPEDDIETIVFGSYARNEAENDSDIDVLVLVNSSRESIADKNWQIGALAADYLFDYGVVVSPIVENREYYRRNRGELPFFRAIDREGVKISA